MKTKPENWSTLTPEQKRDIRLSWLFEEAENIQFISPEAKERYISRTKRMMRALTCQRPDRVPVVLNFGLIPLYEYGVDYYTGINEPAKAFQAFEKFNDKYAEELGESAFAIDEIFPAKAMKILDYKLYVWPGHGMDKSGLGFQFIENEYMKASEYDEFIQDPSYFLMRRYLPRIFGAFEPLNNLKPLTDLLNFAGMDMASLGSPEMQEFLKKLLEASQEFGKFMDLALVSDKQAWARGFTPAFRSTMAIAPFDSLGDSLRGTSSIMMDMYRQPAKLIEALEKVTEMTIHNILSSPSTEQKPTVSMPLHKGADGWMSPKQFDTFYWPYLRRVINAFINEGYLVELFAEGSYNTRLNFVNDFPKGFVNWKFDQSDMAVAKETVGNKCCIQGNVPASLMVTGTPKQVKDYCHKLINDCAPGGGYVLGMGAFTEKPKIENLFAMVEAAKEFGVY